MSLREYFNILNEEFDNVFNFLLNPQHDDTEWFMLLRKFENSGGTVLGKGSRGTVMEHPSWKYVLKIFTDDSFYLKYVRFCLKNHRKSFPVFFDKPRKIVPRFKREKNRAYLYIVRTEKLYPITEKTFSDIEFYLNYNMANVNRMIQLYKLDNWIAIKNRLLKIEKTVPSVIQFKQDYNFLLQQTSHDSGFGALDMKQANIMKRSNGDLVFADPFWAGETMYQKHDRLVNAEIGYTDDEYEIEEPMLKGGELPKKIKKVNKPKQQSPTDDEVPF
jgi:hypothetical protein